MNPVPPICSSSIQSSPAVAGETPYSKQERGFHAVISRVQNLICWLADHPAPPNDLHTHKKMAFSHALGQEDVDIMEIMARDGDIPESDRMRPNIYLVTKPNTPASFRATLESSLEQIEKTHIGKRLLEKIRESPHPFFIAFDESRNHCADPPEGTQIPGRGWSPLIYYSGQDTQYLTTDGTCATRPNFVAFFHELIHAYHFSKGKDVRSGTVCDKMVWKTDEEYKTIIGFPSKNQTRKTPKITENALLAELGLKERMSHHASKVLENHDAFSIRFKATEKVYRQFVEESHYQGQAHSPPPSRLIQVTPEYFGDSKHAMLFYQIKTRHKRSSLSIYLTNPCDFPKNRCWLNYSSQQWPPGLELKKVCPSYCYVQVEGMGIFRLSDAEAEGTRTFLRLQKSISFENASQRRG
jgi:hypothetical protein